MVVTTASFLMTMQEHPHAHVACYHMMLWRWDCPFGKRHPEKFKKAGGIGSQNGCESNSEHDVNLDAVALGDNDLCCVDFESDDEDYMLVG